MIEERLDQKTYHQTTTLPFRHGWTPIFRNVFFVPFHRQEYKDCCFWKYSVFEKKDRWPSNWSLAFCIIVIAYHAFLPPVRDPGNSLFSLLPPSFEKS